ncbi:uncharacterized protein EV154DRAFT_393458, partial [Mucor mucedo]|uniref:uncharacterized protein n=1 Tax=Mucor mucedo TaxID=29922 RepID=UPI00221FD64F
REGLWENMFDLSKVQRQRVLGHSDSTTLEVDNPAQTRFAFSINTDGHMVSVLFE